MSSANPYDVPFALTSEYRTLVIVLGVVSTISTVSVFLLLLHLFIVSFFSGKDRDHDERILLRTHFGAFVLFLLLSDLTQGISGMMELGWASRGQIIPGSFCTAQGIMLQTGDVGTAVWNAIIAIHTFWAVVLGRKMTNRAAVSLSVIGWAICLFLTTIGPLAIETKEKGPFYGVAGAWCFIATNYAYQRVLLHYLPMLLSAGIITVLYVLVALVLFRVLIVHGSTWRFEAPTRKSGSIVRDFFGQFSWGRLYRTSNSVTTHSVVITERPDISINGAPNDTLGHGWRNSSHMPGNRNLKISDPTSSHAEMSEIEDPLSTMTVRLKKLAIKMLWYPSVYLVLILPVAISRIDMSINVSLSVMLGFTCLLLFMGTANTIIFACTRRLGPAPWARRTIHSQSKVEYGNMRPTQSQLSMQIRVDRHTQPGIDDRSIDLPRKKSLASIITDMTTFSSTAKHGISKEDFAFDHRDSKAGFESPGGIAMRNVPSPSSSADPHMVTAHQPHPFSPERQDQYSPYPFASRDPPAQQKEQEQPQEWTYPHPYSRSQFLCDKLSV